jgi:hypothetical protein
VATAVALLIGGGLAVQMADGSDPALGPKATATSSKATAAGSKASVSTVAAPEQPLPAAVPAPEPAPAPVTTRAS